MDIGGFAKVLMIELLMHDKRETSETSEMNEIYSGYLRFYGTIDSV